MPTPQPGIFALGTSSHAYLEFDIVSGVDAGAAVAAAASMREPRTTMGGVNLVTGFRPELWRKIAPKAVPSELAGFNTPLVGPDGYTMPATQRDMVMWLTGPSYDVVFDLSRDVASALAPYALLANEMVGWPYHHDRDLTGFIDGTENPSLIEATDVAIIPEGQPGEGGSILLLQKWAHDVSEWERLGVKRQEQVIGRRKTDSKELDPKPAGSHVARTDQDAFGKIFRRNIPYGDLDDHGTVFVGFCTSQIPLQAMLESMLGLSRGKDAGVRDDLTRFTRPLTGAYYFVPAADRLAEFGDQRADG